MKYDVSIPAMGGNSLAAATVRVEWDINPRNGGAIVAMPWYIGAVGVSIPAMGGNSRERRDQSCTHSINPRNGGQ